MFEAKYYKDYNHNYIILESKDSDKRQTYQYRMLASNKIESLLKCSVRDVNGAVYFYYDISSKVSVENLYKGKQLSYEQVSDFFFQISNIYRNLGQYFMDERGLLVRPDCIYYDLSYKKYFGLYYPDKENQIENQYEELMDFLLEHIDTGNQKLVDTMYQIYEMSESQNFLLTDALSVFDETETEAPDVHNIVGENIPSSISMNDENYYKDHDDEEEYLFLTEDVKKNKGKAAKQESSGKYYGIFAAISLAGICAAGFIYFNYKLTQQELMMIICCLVLMGVCFIFSVIQLSLFGRKEKKKEQEERELQYDIEDEFRDEKPVVLRDVLDKNIYAGANMVEPGHREVKESYGETVFIDTNKQNTEHKLYALDKKNKKHIELTQFPFTIGKMAGCVDCVLMDDSISRMHARIEMQDEKILLTDMNSTNGTYKNGLRMEPSETVELEPGDEIRFGKLNYCYR
ncbi:MAG: FHA domain-containing protein [Lachnospiraceae bacterium]|nr:FHA domain-containing protein [Lachnospiraceae bacterium]